MRIFLDASAMVPMEVPQDQHRPRLDAVMRRLRMAHGDDLEFVTTNWTLYEALAQARRRGWQASMQLFQRIEEFADIVPVDESTEVEALHRFLHWRDKSASVVDYANALVAQARRCQAVLSFDDDFVPLTAAAGMRLLA